MRLIFIEFFIYSVLGYLLEIVYASILNKRLYLNRGFLTGPYCPIYGVALLFIKSLTMGIRNIIFKTLLASLVVVVIEYSTAFLLEKVFHKTFWDYRRKRFNIKGRVCLENTLFFALASTLFVDKISPLIDKMLNSETTSIIVLSFMLFMIFIFDLFTSFKRHMNS